MSCSRSSAAAAAPCGPAAEPSRIPLVVRLGDLEVAPENLRYGEAPDDDIPQLAETVAAAGLLQYPTVRPGRRGEAAHMVLDGRRRLLALRLLRDAGRIDDDHPVEVFVETDRARQAAAVVLTNTAVPVHIADVIAAMGRMLKARLTITAIARALGYGETEIRRLSALSALPSVALEALKSGRIILRQARLLARLKDGEEQAALARAAMDGCGLQEWRIQELLGEGRITTRDPRCGLVTPELYAAEGGRTEADLFGELPPVLLDPDRLTRAWLKRGRLLADIFEAEGLTVRLCPGEKEAELPDDMERLCYAYGGLSETATVVYRETRDRAQAAADVVEAALAGEALPSGEGRLSDQETLGLVEALIRARIAQDQAGAGRRLAVLIVLRPSLRSGVEIECFAPLEAVGDGALDGADGADEEGAEEERSSLAPSRSTYVPPQAEAPMPETQGVSHVLHAVRTDTATRGLIRALAEKPSVALTVLIARLFASLAVWPPVSRGEAALAISASAFAPASGRVIAGLDGIVREQLDERRRAWEASGLTVIAWVHALQTEDRFGLMAELTALSLDLHEPRTGHVRRAARAEAAEIAVLCDADLSRWWTPDGAYLRPHSREQLLSMLEGMGAETEAPARMRKGDLVAWTEEQAAARRWTPACLSWAGEAESEADGAFEPADAATSTYEDADAAGDGSGEPSSGAADGEEIDGADEASGRGVFIVTPKGEAALRGAAA